MRVTYVKSGISGYGPDLDQEDAGYTTVEAICNALRWELDSWIDINVDAAEIAASLGDYETAWKTHKLTEDLETLRANLNWDRRKDAPLYVNNLPLLEDAMLEIIGSRFPLDVDLAGTRRLYVWEAEEEYPQD